MNYADVLSAIRKCLLSDSTVVSYVSDRVWVAHTDNVINLPCVIIELRSPGKSDASHAHRRLQVNIRCYANSNYDALQLQSAVENALRQGYSNILLSPIVYIEADCPFQAPTGEYYGVFQNFFVLAKEAT